MDNSLELKIVLVIALIGMLFAGYMSYIELVVAPEGAFLILDVPACIYGFLIFLAIFFVSLLGIKALRR